MGESPAFLEAVEVLTHDEDAWQLLAEPRRSLAVELSRPANDNLAAVTRRALGDTELTMQLAAFCELGAADRASLLAAARDPVLLRVVSRYKTDESYRRILRALDGAEEQASKGARIDAETALTMETLLGPDGAPLRKAIARVPESRSLPGNIESFCALDFPVRWGALTLARRAPAVLARIVEAPDLADVLATLAVLPEARALLSWFATADAAGTEPGESLEPDASGAEGRRAASAIAGSALLRWRRDADFRQAVQAMNGDCAARLVSRLPGYLVREIAMRLDGPGAEELEALMALLPDGAFWRQTPPLARLPMEVRTAGLDLLARHPRLLARLAADRELLASLMRLADDAELAQLVRDAGEALATRSGRWSLARKIAFGRKGALGPKVGLGRK
ncbi:MAG: hypothetical protein ACFE0R_05805 [Salinarimonas sp.]